MGHWVCSLPALEAEAASYKLNPVRYDGKSSHPVSSEYSWIKLDAAPLVVLLIVGTAVPGVVGWMVGHKLRALHGGSNPKERRA